MAIPIWVWALNIIGVVTAVWFLSWRLKSKLAEVEDRHVMSGIRHRNRLQESEQLDSITLLESTQAWVQSIQERLL